MALPSLPIGAEGDDSGLKPLSEQKRRQILQAAGKLFVTQGFETTTMDAIAREAGVSKATVYAHAKNKQDLFAAIVSGVATQVYQLVDAVSEMRGAEAVLREFALRFLEVIITPPAQGVYRMVVAEAPRNPELGRIFFEHGPAIVQGRLAAIIEGLNESGELEVDDPVIAAQEFLGLMQGRFHLPCILGTLDELSEQDRRQAAERTANTFLRAYGTRGKQGSTP
jgi:TetR/AcrR family transcriptional regulator, mexJK operon transcriptional repressor